MMSSREQYDAAQQGWEQRANSQLQRADQWHDDAVSAEAQVRRVSARNEQLRVALEDALEEMQCMIGYVDEYSRDKWGLDAYIERARAALEDK